MNKWMRASVLWLASLVLAAAPLGCGGCGENNNDISDIKSGRIQVVPDPIAFSQVDIGANEEIFVTIINGDDEPLSIFEYELRGRDGGSADGLELKNMPQPPFEIEGNGQVEFSVMYAPSLGTPPPRAEIAFISSDDRFTREEPKRVPIDALGNSPRIEIVPPAVRFARLPVGGRDAREVKIRNVGSAPLTLHEEPVYSGGNDFSLELEPRSYPFDLEIWDSEKAQENPERYEMTLTVNYVPRGNGADTGEIRIVSNDPSGTRESDTGEIRAVTTVDVQANADAPCIFVDGTTRNFGQVPIGSASADVVTLQNCGTQPLEIDSIRIDENTADAEFEIDLQGLDVDGDGDIDSTIRLQPGQEEQFFLKYTPVQEGTDRGSVTILSNDPLQRELILDLLGRGSNGVCPVAQAGAYIRGVNSTPRASLSATPLQYIVLDGTDSFDEDGRVVDWEWEIVSEPDGSAASLGATREDPNDEDMSRREFRLLVAGEYVIELRVRDNEGFESCGDPARVVIRAVPNEKIHVELTWTNPEDPDETDDVGSDVDLHMVKMGPGKWFETPYDIYFRNPNNSAGSENNGIWNPESPSLDIDDRDGGGPENIQMNDPANCEWYAVGVHYYQQLFGTAYATVRIYINAQLVYEAINKPLVRGGWFWDVARVHWDTGLVYEYGNIFEAPPASQAPDVTDAMIDSGLCTQQDLYPVQ